MSRAQLAYVDIPVPRVNLANPDARRAIREILWRKACELGTVDSRTIKYSRDPTNGPHEPTNEVAVVRLSAMIVPRD